MIRIRIPKYRRYNEYCPIRIDIVLRLLYLLNNWIFTPASIWLTSTRGNMMESWCRCPECLDRDAKGRHWWRWQRQGRAVKIEGDYRLGPLYIQTDSNQLFNFYWGNQEHALFQILGHRHRPLFSERHGYRVPTIRVLGWRLFIRDNIHQ